MRTSFALAVLAIAFLLTTPSFAHDQQPLDVSMPLLKAIEAWSTESATAETIAREGYPEALDAYAPRVAQFLGALRLAPVLAEDYPQAIEAFLEAGGDPREDADVLRFFMDRYPADYYAWQQDARLTAGRKTFPAFAADHYPAVIVDLDAANWTPAEQGISLVSFH
ncbi:MAG: hypothetical protein AAFY88_10515, partial [Acidobacteriota bacterium]